MVTPLLKLGKAMECAQYHLAPDIVVKTGLCKRAADIKKRNSRAFPGLQDFGMQLPDRFGDLVLGSLNKSTQNLVNIMLLQKLVGLMMYTYIWCIVMYVENKCNIWQMLWCYVMIYSSIDFEMCINNSHGCVGWIANVCLLTIS